MLRASLVAVLLVVACHKGDSWNDRAKAMARAACRCSDRTCWHEKVDPFVQSIPSDIDEDDAKDIWDAHHDAMDCFTGLK